MAPVVSRLLAFAGVEEFSRRHRGGTEAEFAGTQKLVEETNKRNLQFQAWFVSTTRQTSKRVEYLVVVRPGQDGEGKMPQLGEPAKLRVALGDDAFTRFWEARRLETPTAALRAAANPAEKLTYFKVTSTIADAHQGVRTLLDFPAAEADDNTDDTTSSCDREVALTNENSVLVNFLLVASEATKNSELSALDHLWGRFANASEQQTLAFKYFVTLRDPEFFVDLHQQIPHLKSAMDDPTWPGSPLEKKFARLNPQQKAAYLEGFRHLECGICILPGGPGAGKTHFNIFTIAMAQSQPLPRPVMIKGKPVKRSARVLFIVDMNAPVDDVANRMVATYKELGMNKVCIRMKGWGSEISSSDRLNSVEDAGSGDVVPVDFTNGFLETAKLMGTGDPRRTCQALTLDEAAWQRYDTFKSTEYEGLTEYLNTDLWEEAELVPFRFRCLLYHLYRDTLDNADFIATTPVAASNHFKGMFKPDLVYFDEAPHARELTNLIAIANFQPIAYIFCGDHRQTIPFVGSAGEDDENPFKEQMQTSMMERAAAAGVIRHELLMNHRAFGGLEQLASAMWYDGKMISGNESTPASVTHMQNYLGQFKDGKPCTIPRLLVHLKNCGPESRDGTSAWNPTHMTWVMERINELLLDPEFKHAERDQPGTILVISPYKKAFHEYKKQIKKLPDWAQKRVETRTVDVVQGHEADFVFLDLVKERSTKFLDNPNRLCVALTRARIGEIVMMHPNMVHSATFKWNSENLRPIHELCSKAGQVVHVDPATSSRITLPPLTPADSQVCPVDESDGDSVLVTPELNNSPSAVRSERSSSIHSEVASSTRSAAAVSNKGPSSSAATSPSIKITGCELQLSTHAPTNDEKPTSEAGDQVEVETTSAPSHASGLAMNTCGRDIEGRNNFEQGDASTVHDEVSINNSGVANIDDGAAWWAAVMGTPPVAKTTSTPSVSEVSLAAEISANPGVSDEYIDCNASVASDASDASIASGASAVSFRTDAANSGIASIDDTNSWWAALMGKTAATDPPNVTAVSPELQISTAMSEESGSISSFEEIEDIERLEVIEEEIEDEIEDIKENKKLETIEEVEEIEENEAIWKIEHDQTRETAATANSPVAGSVDIPISSPKVTTANIDDTDAWWAAAVGNSTTTETSNMSEASPDIHIIPKLSENTESQSENIETNEVCDTAAEFTPTVANTVDVHIIASDVKSNEHGGADIDDANDWWATMMNRSTALTKNTKATITSPENDVITESAEINNNAPRSSTPMGPSPVAETTETPIQICNSTATKVADISTVPQDTNLDPTQPENSAVETAAASNNKYPSVGHTDDHAVSGDMETPASTKLEHIGANNCDVIASTDAQRVNMTELHGENATSTCSSPATKVANDSTTSINLQTFNIEPPSDYAMNWWATAMATLNKKKNTTLSSSSNAAVEPDGAEIVQEISFNSSKNIEDAQNPPTDAEECTPDAPTKPNGAAAEEPAAIEKDDFSTTWWNKMMDASTSKAVSSPPTSPVNYIQMAKEPVSDSQNNNLKEITEQHEITTEAETFKEPSMIDEIQPGIASPAGVIEKPEIQATKANVRGIDDSEGWWNAMMNSAPAPKATYNPRPTNITVFCAHNITTPSKNKNNAQNASIPRTTTPPHKTIIGDEIAADSPKINTATEDAIMSEHTFIGDNNSVAGERLTAEHNTTAGNAPMSDLKFTADNNTASVERIVIDTGVVAENKIITTETPSADGNITTAETQEADNSVIDDCDGWWNAMLRSSATKTSSTSRIYSAAKPASVAGVSDSAKASSVTAVAIDQENEDKVATPKSLIKNDADTIDNLDINKAINNLIQHAPTQTTSHEENKDSHDEKMYKMKSEILDCLKGDMMQKKDEIWNELRDQIVQELHKQIVNEMEEEMMSKLVGLVKQMYSSRATTESVIRKDVESKVYNTIKDEMSKAMPAEATLAKLSAMFAPKD